MSSLGLCVGWVGLGWGGFGVCGVFWLGKVPTAQSHSRPSGGGPPATSATVGGRKPEAFFSMRQADDAPYLSKKAMSENEKGRGGESRPSLAGPVRRREKHICLVPRRFSAPSNIERQTP